MLPTNYIIHQVFGTSFKPDADLDISKSLRKGVADYIAYGYHPGGFLSAVIANDLYLAATRADFENRQNLADIARWVYLAFDSSHVARLAYGSLDAIDRWCCADNEVRLKLLADLEKNYTWYALVCGI